MVIDIRSIHFTADQKLTDRIETKVSKLERFFPKIIEAKVALKLENSGQVRDKICEIRIKVPRDLIVVQSSSKTFEAACDNAVRTVKRRLVKLKEKIYQR